ncbi:hypothetical protein EXS73_00155 [Candidatus Pacearchaeota archaeon]|nr:hypothetical protein [Candidatus Pacearchaeota archaeon]
MSLLDILREVLHEPPTPEIREGARRIVERAEYNALVQIAELNRGVERQVANRRGYVSLPSFPYGS